MVTAIKRWQENTEHEYKYSNIYTDNSAFYSIAALIFSLLFLLATYS